MAKIKKQLKKFGRYVWELFKGSLPSCLMYFCAGTVLLMLTMRGETLEWGGSSIAWTWVCIVVAAGYNFLMGWVSGGSHYEMLVSGNIKRVSAEEYGVGYKISSHKEAGEYRVWKGFAIGGFMALFPLVFGILFGCNQATIDSGTLGGGSAALVLIGFLLSGWSVIPLYLMNNAGGFAINYFVSCLFALLPIVITGVSYVCGAYSRRNKRLREQLVAQKAAEAEANKVKKINYGGLPGTKPKKKK